MKTRAMFWINAWLVFLQLVLAAGLPSAWGSVAPAVIPVGESSAGSVRTLQRLAFIELGDHSIHRWTGSHDAHIAMDLESERLWRNAGEPRGLVLKHQARLRAESTLMGLVWPTVRRTTFTLDGTTEPMWHTRSELVAPLAPDVRSEAIDTIEASHPALGPSVIAALRAGKTATETRWWPIVFEFLWIVPLALAVWSFPATLGYRRARHPRSNSARSAPPR